MIEVRFTLPFIRRLKPLTKRYRKIQSDIQPIIEQLQNGNLIGDQISGLDFTIRCAQLGKMVLLKEIGLLYRLSDGQWHTNIDELSSNMTLISQRYSAYLGLELHQRHLDYYFWIEVRKHGHKHLISTVLRDLTGLRFARLQMLHWLLSRNLKALWAGWWNRKLVREQLEILKS